jgi:hypothetical protein
MLHPSAYNTAPLGHQARPRGGLRLRLLALVGALEVTAGWLAGLTTSGRGWLAIAGAMALTVTLALHRRNGGGRLLARVLLEYGAVALVVALVVTIAPTTLAGGEPPAHHRTTTAHTAKPTSAGDVDVGQLAGEARAWLVELWRQAQDKTPRSPAKPNHHP